jgi:hypothetical protein
MLKQTYETLRSLYDYIIKWSKLSLTAWAGLLALGLQVEGQSGAMILISALALLTLAYEMQQGGRGLTAAWSVAFALERDLGIPITKSHMIGGLVSFRGQSSIDELRELSELENEDVWLAKISSSKNSVFHIKRSKTAIIAVTVAVLQISVTLALMLSGRLSF